MQNIISNVTAGIGINDIIDILLVGFIIYKLLEFIKESRAEQLIKGLLIFVAATVLSGLFNLHTLNWILKGAMTVGVIAVIVVFQPELRRGLEYIGRSKIIKSGFSHMDDEKAAKIIGEFTECLVDLSKKKTGALVIIERETSLSDICESGIRIDAEVTKELLGNLFYEGSPLHDGAVIIRDTRIHSAGCVLPLTQNFNLPTELGTRHRAGIGVTENSDCITLIVSEETGVISTARDGKLQRYLDKESLEKLLLDVYKGEEKSDILTNVRNAASKWGRDKDV